ncbi:DUF2628 domain-containing protein [Acidisoma cellulosilytica]|uniref:DUF2628 domain-containing protein n=1 Tax=Acidisoma cellulosilyticum TaxID=2802395 RepID=A0A963YYK8_9PROT|nr:DUF2628 domain-containing protein [Acidisoma cellulosilyticum]MCB8879643.1 DUF2628 domain-containing protein [Acidisoma cellulosilyticum]
MKVYTAHLRPGRLPHLVREGFSLGAFLFGPLWLFANRAWIAGVIALAVLVGILTLASVLSGATPCLLLAYAAVMGFNGRDLQRWSLGRRGFTETYVVAGRDAEAAYGRLLLRDPSLASEELA